MWFLAIFILRATIFNAFYFYSWEKITIFNDFYFCFEYMEQLCI